MNEAEFTQKKEELTRFRATELFRDISESIQNHRRQLLLSLIRQARRSHDPYVKAIAESFVMETTFERVIRGIESPDSIKQKAELTDDGKQYHDFNSISNIELSESDYVF